MINVVISQPTSMMIYSKVNLQINEEYFIIIGLQFTMKSIGAFFSQPDAFPEVNHMSGMQYQTVLNIIFCYTYIYIYDQMIG